MPSCYLQLCSSQLASQKSPAGLKNPTHHNTESAKHTTFFVRRFMRCDKSRVGPGGCGRLDDPSMRWAGGHKTHQAHPKLASTHSGKPFFPVRHQFLMSAHEARHIFLMSAQKKNCQEMQMASRADARLCQALMWDRAALHTTPRVRTRGLLT